MDDEMNRMSLENQKRSLSIRIWLIFIGVMIVAGTEIYIAIRFIVHWFSNDGLSFMQNLKWWFNEYIFILIICIVARLILKACNNKWKEDKFLLERQIKINKERKGL